jgi:hypothetical protein
MERDEITLLFYFICSKTRRQKFILRLRLAGGNVFKFVKLFALYQESISKRIRDVTLHRSACMGIGLFGNTGETIQRRVLDKAFYV